MLRSRNIRKCSRNPSRKTGNRVLFSDATSSETTPRKYNLDNGATLAIQETRGEDVAIVAAFPYGQVDHPYRAHLAEHLLFRDVGGPRKGDIDFQVEKLGGWYTGYTERDRMVLLLRVRRENSKNAMKLLVRSLINTEFSQKQLDLEKDIIQGECRERVSDTMYNLGLFQERHVLRDHPLLIPKETLRGTREIKLDELIDEKRRFMGARNLYIGIVGSDPDRLLEDAVSTIGTLPTRGGRKHKFKPINIEGTTRTMPESRGEVTVSVLVPAAGYESDDLYSLEVLAHHLTGLSRDYETRSRFWKEIRQKRGEMYHATTFYDAFEGIGLMEFFVTGILPKNTISVRSLIADEIDRTATRELTEQRFEEVRDNLLSVEEATLREEAIEETAERITLAAMYGIPNTYRGYKKELEALDPATIQKTAQKYFGGKNFAVTTYKPA